jgi:hypothetical protein
MVAAELMDKMMAYSVLVKNVNDDAELTGVGAVVDDGNAADLDETLEHLWGTNEWSQVGGTRSESILGVCIRLLPIDSLIDSIDQAPPHINEPVPL